MVRVKPSTKCDMDRFVLRRARAANAPNEWYQVLSGASLRGREEGGTRIVKTMHLSPARPPAFLPARYTYISIRKILA